MQTYEFVATCLFGLEKLLGDEITALGYERTETIDGRVTFRGDISAFARANIWLRFAERVYLKMGEFEAKSFEELFVGVRYLPWEEWIGRDDQFPVKGHSIKSVLTSIPDCQSIVKKAVVERMKEEHGVEWFSEEGVKYQIEFFILKDKVTMMIDLSGEPLHKRGYRLQANGAPLRETLAAALSKFACLKEDVLLWDPFCGSGTIPIEAALMMANVAPGIVGGRKFAAEEFYDLPESIWTQAREEAADLRKTDCGFEAFATDIDPAAVEIAKENIRRAGVGGAVKCFVKDALTVEKENRRATLICNPPYGERLMSPDEVNKLYRDMGKVFRELEPWQIYIITSSEEFERLYGRRADKVRKLYNGMIKCGYYEYFKPAAARAEQGFRDRNDRNRGEGKPWQPHGDRPYGDRSKPYDRKNGEGKPFERRPYRKKDQND